MDFSTNAYRDLALQCPKTASPAQRSKLIDDDRPFTEAATSEQYVDPGSDGAYRLSDAALVSDDGTSGSGRRNLATQGQSFQFSTTQDVVFTSASNIPVDQSASRAAPTSCAGRFPRRACT